MGFELNSLEPVDESFMPLNLFQPFRRGSNPCLQPLHCVGFSCLNYMIWPVSTWWVYTCSISCQKFAKSRSWIEANIWRNSLGQNLDPKATKMITICTDDVLRDG